MTFLPPYYTQENQTFISLLVSFHLPHPNQAFSSCSKCEKVAVAGDEVGFPAKDFQSNLYNNEMLCIHLLKSTFIFLFAHTSRHAATCEQVSGRWMFFWPCIDTVTHVPEGLGGRKELWNVNQENAFLSFSLGFTLPQSMATQHQHIRGFRLNKSLKPLISMGMKGTWLSSLTTGEGWVISSDLVPDM